MSKPELPKKIESLPASPPATGKKTGWEPPSPQKVRTSETRMGILLAFCLLAAIGFVAYRKLDEKRQKGASPAEFLTADEKKNGEQPETGGAPDRNEETLPDPPGPTPVAALSNWPAEQRAEPETSTTPNGLSFAATDAPEQTEPVASSADSTFEGGTTFDTATTIDSSSGVDSTTVVETQPADDAFNPFAGSETVVESAEPEDAVNPFATASEVESEQQVFTSDAGTQETETGSTFGVVEQDHAATDRSLADGGQTFESENPTTSSDADVVEMPAIDLLQSEPATASLPEQQTEPESSSTSSGSPWDQAPAGGLDSPVIADANPPELLEPNDPQEMPTLTLGPFDEPASVEQPPAQAPEVAAQPESQDFNPFPTATATTEVRQPMVEQHAPSENPFGAAEEQTVQSRSSTTPRDPFAPARDISQAVNEDEVLVHQVASGENFWSIAQQHYGAGKYFNALAAYNQSRIPDPKRMRPGMKVLVPSKETLAEQFPQLVSGGSSTPYAALPTGPAGFTLDAQGRPQYRVAKGDTLSDIAEKHLGRASRWRQVYGMNREQLPDENSLTTGMILRLPADATQVRMDPARAISR